MCANVILSCKTCAYCYCRQHWEEVSAKKHSFHVGDQIGEINETALRRARALHDTFFGSPAAETTRAVRQPFQDVQSCCSLCCGALCVRLFAQVSNKRDRAETSGSGRWDWGETQVSKKAKFDNGGKKVKGKGKGKGDQDMSSVKCFKCNAYGHYAVACPNKNK